LQDFQTTMFVLTDTIYITVSRILSHLQDFQTTMFVLTDTIYITQTDTYEKFNLL